MAELLGSPSWSLVNSFARQVFMQENKLYLQAYEEAKGKWGEYAFKRFFTALAVSIGISAVVFVIFLVAGSGDLGPAVLISIAVTLCLLFWARKKAKASFEGYCQDYPFGYPQVTRFVPLADIRSKVVGEVQRVMEQGGNTWMEDFDSQGTREILRRLQTTQHLGQLPDGVTVISDLLVKERAADRIVHSIDNYVITNAGSILIGHTEQPSLDVREIKPNVHVILDEPTATDIIHQLEATSNSRLHCDAIIMVGGLEVSHFFRDNGGDLFEAEAIRNPFDGQLFEPRNLVGCPVYVCRSEAVAATVETVYGLFTEDPQLHYETLDDVRKNAWTTLSTDPEIDLVNTATLEQLEKEAKRQKIALGVAAGAAALYGVKKYRDKH